MTPNPEWRSINVKISGKTDLLLLGRFPGHECTCTMSSRGLSIAIKKCLMYACRFVDIPMRELRSTFHVTAAELIGEKEKEPRRYFVSGSQTPIEGIFDWRYRDWSIKFRIEYIDRLSQKRILDLLRIAGAYTGIGLGSPYREGFFGTFGVEVFEELTEGEQG